MPRTRSRECRFFMLCPLCYHWSFPSRATQASPLLPTPLPPLRGRILVAVPTGTTQASPLLPTPLPPLRGRILVAVPTRTTHASPPLRGRILVVFFLMATSI